MYLDKGILKAFNEKLWLQRWELSNGIAQEVLIEVKKIRFGEKKCFSFKEIFNVIWNLVSKSLNEWGMGWTQSHFHEVCWKVCTEPETGLWLKQTLVGVNMRKLPETIDMHEKWLVGFGNSTQKPQYDPKGVGVTIRSEECTQRNPLNPRKINGGS